jgi:hypothetical protein
MLEAAHERKQPHLLNPRQARDFACSLGLLAKAAKIDAKTLRAASESAIHYTSYLLICYHIGFASPEFA